MYGKLLLLMLGAALFGGLAFVQPAEAEYFVIGGTGNWGIDTFNDTFGKSDVPNTAMGALGNPEHTRLTLRRNAAVNFSIVMSFYNVTLPAGSVVTSANLQLTEQSGRTLNSGNTSIYEMTTWTPPQIAEYTMTWNSQPCRTGTTLIFNSNCNSTAESTVTVSVEDIAYNWSVTNIVQRTLAAGNSSFAVVLTTTASDVQDFCSKENATSCAPKLYIQYSPGVFAPTINNNHTYHGTTLSTDGTWIYDTLNANFDVNVTPTVGSLSNVYIEIDRVNVSMTNSTTNFWFANLTARTIGTHSYRFCADNTDNRSTCTGTSPLNMQLYNDIFNLREPTVFETNTTSFNYSITVTTNATGVSGYHVWNGTNISYDYNPSTGTFGSTKVLPLLTGNNATSVNSFWNWTIVLSNGTTMRGGTTSQTQNLLYAYYFNDLTGTSQMLSYETFSARGRAKNELFIGHVGMNMSLAFQTATLSNATYTANQTWTGPDFLSSWNFSVPFPSIAGDNSTILYNASLSVTDGTNWRTRNLLGNRSVVVYSPSVNSCGTASVAGGGKPVLGFFTYNESTNTNGSIGTNTDMAFYFKLFDPLNSTSFVNSSFNVGAVKSTYVCAYPSNSTLTTDVVVAYNGITDHEPRNYYIYNATLASPPNNIKLFLLHNDAPAYLFPITLKDDSNNLLPDRLIQAQRYYTATNTYETVAMALTDGFGFGNIWLAPNNVYYKFAVYDGATLEDTVSPLLLTCTVSTTCSLNLNIDTGGGNIASLGYIGNIFGGCSWTNSSLTLSCSWYDPQGLTNDFCLDITQFGYIKPIPVMNQCVSTATGTVGHTFGASNTTAQYYWKLTSTLKSGDDNTTIVADGWIQNHGQPVTGNSGLVLGFIVIGTITFLVMFSPIVGIIAMLAAMGIMGMFGIVDYGVGGVAGLAAVGGVIIWYIRRDAR